MTNNLENLTIAIWTATVVTENQSDHTKSFDV